MKVVILAGGLGTRLSEETVSRPKPMIEIGHMPILWHIMKIYSHYGLNDFVICGGYKQYVIKEFFKNHLLHKSDVTFDLTHSDIVIHNNRSEPWKVTVVDTGEDSNTGGRIKKIKNYINKESFCLTYGDGVGSIDINKLIKFHFKNKKLATVTATRPPARFGALDIKNNNVKTFIEKPKGDNNWINGGFFVLEPKVIDYIKDDKTFWEKEPLEKLAKNNQLAAFKHGGFWQPMDTLRDKLKLEELWQSGTAPWKVWD